MKHKIFTALTICMSLSFYSFAAGVPGPGFSLHNKGKQAIVIKIQNGAQQFSARVAPNAFSDQQINLAAPTRLTIGDESGKIIYKAAFPLNKTIYVNYAGDHKPPLYHQQGRLKGILGKTDQGYSTKNNIADKEIQVLENVPDAPPENPFIKAGLPDPNAPNFCADIKKEFGPSGYGKAGLKLHPDRCAAPPNQSKKELCDEAFKKMMNCYGK